MKKITFGFLALALSATAIAGTTDPKIATIKKVYATSTPNYQKYTTSSLRNLEARVSKSVEVCVDYDMATGAQDTDNFRVLGMKSVGNSVKVNISNFGKTSTITYKMVCTGNKCLIDDISDKYGSLRSALNGCL